MADVGCASAKCIIESRVSGKTGKPYKVLVLKFENGYIMETFLNNEQAFILKDTVPCID